MNFKDPYSLNDIILVYFISGHPMRMWTTVMLYRTTSPQNSYWQPSSRKPESEHLKQIKFLNFFLNFSLVCDI